jgi:hypothetical protein
MRDHPAEAFASTAITKLKTKIAYSGHAILTFNHQIFFNHSRHEKAAPSEPSLRVVPAEIK